MKHRPHPRLSSISFVVLCVVSLTTMTMLNGSADIRPGHAAPPKSPNFVEGQIIVQLHERHVKEIRARLPLDSRDVGPYTGIGSVDNLASRFGVRNIQAIVSSRQSAHY